MDDIEVAMARSDVGLMLRSLRRLIESARIEGGSRWLCAAAQQELGDVLAQVCRPDDKPGLREVIAAYRAALEVYTPEFCPVEFATVQNNLGNAYRMLRGSDDTPGSEEAAEAVEQAIAAYLAALAVRTRDTDPYSWARTQNNLGSAYAERLRGKSADNKQKALQAYRAALEVHDVLEYPDDYVMAKTNLGLLYLDLADGTQPDVLDLSMEAFLCAMLARTPRTDPRRRQRLVRSMYDAFRSRLGLTPPGLREETLARLAPVVEVLAQAGAPLSTRSTPVVEDSSAAGVATRVDPCLFASYWHDFYRVIPLPELIAMITSPEADRQPRVRISMLRAALRRDDVVLPSFRAELLDELALALLHHPSDDAAQHQEEAISALETALNAYTREDDPLEWGTIKNHLGAAYGKRLSGDRAENLERAIRYCTDSIGTRPVGSLDWALFTGQLGQLYRDRRFGDPRENHDRAIAAFERAMTVFDREGHPYEWARLRNSMGYTRWRLRRDEADAIEAAVEDFQEALTVLTCERYPVPWAGTLFNLASALLERRSGITSENIEQAIGNLTRSLAVRTREHDAVEWARTQYNLGQAYYRRLSGERADNLDLAARCLRAALEVLTLADRPADHRSTMGTLGMIEAHRGNWHTAHEAFASACTAGDLLLSRVSTGTYGLDDVARQGYEAGELDAFALVQLGRLDEAVEILEGSRARSLAEALAVRSADAERIKDQDRRGRFVEAQLSLTAAQSAIDDVGWRQWDPSAGEGTEADGETVALARAKALQDARRRFQAVVAEIRLEQDPADFLDPVLSADQIAAGLTHPVVYLLATEWGGLALAVGPSSSPAEAGKILALPLPDLTAAFVQDLVQVMVNDRSGRVVGGYGAAQEGVGLGWMVHQWPGDTFMEKAEHLSDACRQAGTDSSFGAAARACVQHPGLEEITRRPLRDLDEPSLSRLAATLHHHILAGELRRCLPRLAEAAMEPLTAWLLEHGMTRVTLVPCGCLPAFPLPCVPVSVPKAEASGAEVQRTAGDLLSMTVAPSARTILAVTNGNGRSGVYALGDPHPTHQLLRWSEAEALTIAALAGDPARARVHGAATRDWLVESLRKGTVVVASCHGEFDSADFLNSRLLLAGGETLTLRDAQGDMVHLDGLRLLILSACQTAVMNLRGAREEVRSLAAGMLRAGAQAILAPLWAVDDRATYLLMVRFAQEWLPAMEETDLAEALAKAQAWLRTVTYRELAAWRTSLAPPQTPRQVQAPPRGRSTRHSAHAAETLIGELAERKAASSPDETPYAEPCFWAGFIVHGR
ncbi:CHAT domain-containing protein [Streptomyces violarus]|uniref:CHAT domain-containing protein n=1 Tax=Streptomyces violarus TaxID=67380 RepID=UPI0021BF9B2F|nr:CHAT domain-containing protein [Streptomyces violarus]MCT9141019.1 CHAT domain-containing protein [Streptomyces violarus]